MNNIPIKFASPFSVWKQINYNTNLFIEIVVIRNEHKYGLPFSRGTVMMNIN